MKYSAAIDLSGKFAGFALAESESKKIILTDHKAMQGRSSSSLCDWLMELIKKAGASVEDIDYWTVGSGPGSFTGMRLVAALVTGISLGRDNIKTRCVPTALTLADSQDFNDGNKIAALFDGRKQEILLFELINKSGEIIPSGKTEVLNKEQAADYFANNTYSQIVALEYDSVNIEKVVPESLFAQIVWKEFPAYDKLISCSYKDYDNDLTDLVYIRPAVFS